MTITTSTSTVSRIVGQWQRASADIDLGAQIITGIHAPVILPALPARLLVQLLQFTRTSVHAEQRDAS